MPLVPNQPELKTRLIKHHTTDTHTHTLTHSHTLTHTYTRGYVVKRNCHVFFTVYRVGVDGK